MKLCMVGCGRWGKAYLKTIQKIRSISVEWIILRKSKPKIEGNYNFSYNLNDLLEKEKVDGVIIVSPPDTHFEFAKICIKKRIPILIEKPFTASYKQSKFLIEEFNKHKLVCMVGYQHLYSEKYKLLKKKNPKIGKIDNIYSISLSDGPFRKKISVIRDWGSHEVALAIDLFDDLPKSVIIKKINKNCTNLFKGVYSLNMKFSRGRQFYSLFGNQSLFKKNHLILEYEKGLIYQDNLSQYGNLTISKNKFQNLDEIFQSYSFPLESLIKEFQKNVKNKNYSTNMYLSLNVNKILDQLERKALSH